MKTYMCAGIGDMFCVDTLLTQQERESITEIYWGCRFGKDLAPLISYNYFYPNVQKQHIISDEIGMAHMDSYSKLFWHYRGDFPDNFRKGVELFGICKEDIDQDFSSHPVIFDRNRTFQGSTFLQNACREDIESIVPQKYILIHAPTSTRPRSDITVFTEQDWDKIYMLVDKYKLPLVVVSDYDIPIKEKTGVYSCLNLPLKTVVALCKYAKMFIGCDSFCSILCSKVLNWQHMVIKSHDSNIKNTVMHHYGYQTYFLPQTPDILSSIFTYQI